MSDYEVLSSRILDLGESISSYSATVNRMFETLAAETRRLWDDNAELRDELHALSNRVEALTRAQLHAVGDDNAA